MREKVIITIDGPSASGKGTIARMLGDRLSLPVLYTGNIFRAIAQKLIDKGIDPKDINSVVKLAKELTLEDTKNPNLSAEKIGEYASIIGVYPELRNETNIFQRNFIKESKGAVVEGRDIGTVICPEAPYKFYITADVEIRAKRRCAQLTGTNYEDVLEDLKRRDVRDQSRLTAPLKPAKDAIIIDNSKLDAEQTLSFILKKIV